MFDDQLSQAEIFADCARPIVDAVLNGYNATIFAYGQTGDRKGLPPGHCNVLFVNQGTGKTYTMEGALDEHAGIMPRVFSHIFRAIQASNDLEYLVRASYLELYNEELHDLLDKHSKAKLELKENRDSGVYVKNLRTVVVETEDDMNKILQARVLTFQTACIEPTSQQIGGKNRSVGQTLMNKDSSRSHSVFSITIESVNRDVQGKLMLKPSDQWISMPI